MRSRTAALSQCIEGLFFVKIYTSLKSVPGLADLEPAERKAVWDAYLPKTFLSWQVLLAFLFLLAFTSAGVELRSALKAHFTQVPWEYIDFPIIVLSYSIGFFVVYQAQVRVVMRLFGKSKSGEDGAGR